MASGLLGRGRLLGLGLQEALVEQAVVSSDAGQDETGGAGWHVCWLKSKPSERLTIWPQIPKTPSHIPWLWDLRHDGSLRARWEVTERLSRCSESARFRAQHPAPSTCSGMFSRRLAPPRQHQRETRVLWFVPGPRPGRAMPSPPAPTRSRPERPGLSTLPTQRSLHPPNSPMGPGPLSQAGPKAGALRSERASAGSGSAQAHRSTSCALATCQTDFSFW